MSNVFPLRAAKEVACTPHGTLQGTITAAELAQWLLTLLSTSPITTVSFDNKQYLVCESQLFEVPPELL